MITNKALAELRLWACAASDGDGTGAKEHLVAFNHVAAGLVASKEFRQRCQELFGEQFDSSDLARTVRILDAIANIEVHQVDAFGPGEA